MLQRLKPSTILLAVLTLLAFAPAPPAAGQDADGSRRLVVEAGDGLEWRRHDQVYIASGNATATQGDTTLRADRIEARYRDDEGEVVITSIEGVDGAELRKGGITARADRIDYDLQAELALLTGGVPTVTTNGRSITAAESIDYDRGNRLVRAEGRVTVDLGDGRRLEAASIHATVNEAEDDFTFVRAVGGAEVFAPGPNGERRATADEIEYTKAEDLAVLEGAVEIFDGGNYVTGDRAEINLAKGTSNITSRSGRVGGVFTTAE